jgi:3-hydroxyacyl-[acyl-carrier-protein] dehydratase
MNENPQVDIEKILELLPHRYPFLLVDRVLSYNLDDPPSIRALKNVTINEPFFQGHFPGHPVMPGVLLLEAMAQAAGCLAHLAREESGGDNRLYYLVKIDKARFNRIVVPGDQLIFEVELVAKRTTFAKIHGRALVGGDVVCEADMLSAMGNRP